MTLELDSTKILQNGDRKVKNETIHCTSVNVKHVTRTFATNASFVSISMIEQKMNGNYIRQIHQSEVLISHQDI